MTHLFTMTKQLPDGRASNWRFIDTPDGLCALGGNKKVLTYRNRVGLDKSVAWFKTKGYSVVPA